MNLIEDLIAGFSFGKCPDFDYLADADIRGSYDGPLYRIVDPESFGADPILEDNFDTFDMDLWRPEVTMSGGGNNEFEMYVNNRSTSFVEDGKLHLKPIQTADWLGEERMKTGSLDFGDECTDSFNNGCKKDAGQSGVYLNPVMSAKLTTKDSFNMKYGRVQVNAKMPAGKWIWPAIWLLPKDQRYGGWPTSGEIDLVEARGNEASCPGGRNQFATTLHLGPRWDRDAWSAHHAEHNLPSGDLSEDFHLYELLWTSDTIESYIDGQRIFHTSTVDLWDKDKAYWQDIAENPWQSGGDDAPFDEKFYLIFNVAVGGTNGYFPDSQCGKCWSNSDPYSINAFWENKDQWIDTWAGDEAMQIDWIKVYQLQDLKMERAQHSTLLFPHNIVAKTEDFAILHACHSFFGLFKFEQMVVQLREMMHPGITDSLKAVLAEIWN